MRQYNIESDLVLVKPIEPVVYKQYDNGDTLEVELFQDNEKINLTTEIVLAFFELGDGTVIQKTCSISNGNAIATLDNNILSIDKEIKVEFTVYGEDGEQTTTRTVLIAVETSIKRNEAIETVPQWDIVSQIIIDGRDIIAGAEQATINANASATNADAKAMLANQAAINADNAANDASIATINANEKATLADQAAFNANEKATLANDATTNANQAATEAEQATQAINLVLPNVEGLHYINPYDSNISYEKNNIVSYKKASYISLIDNNIGNTPPENTPDAYWGVLALGGIDGMGSVVTVNGVSPDANGNVTIVIPDPDLNGLATKQELQDVDNDLIAHKADMAQHNQYMDGATKKQLTFGVNKTLGCLTVTIGDVI